MNNILDDLNQISSLVNLGQLIAESPKDNFSLFISNLFGSARNLFVKLLCEKEQQIFLLCEDSKSLDESNAELSILGLSNKTILIREPKPDILQEMLTEISTRNNFILLSTYDLLTYSLPNQEEIRKNTMHISVGGDLSYDNLVERLNLLNYQKENFVEAPGDFSQRGAIIDFWSYGEKNPVRLEFDGDFIESIRNFEPESQRSIEPIQTTTLAGELSTSQHENTSTIFNYLKNPVVIAGKYALDNLALAPTDRNDEETHFVKIDSDKTDVIGEDYFPDARHQDFRN